MARRRKKSSPGDLLSSFWSATSQTFAKETRRIHIENFNIL